MPVRSPNTVRVAKRVRRLKFAQAAVRHTGRALVAAVLLGFMLVLGIRLGWLPLDWVGALSACIAGGLAIAMLLALRRDWSLLTAAQAADRALGLKDRLSTALSLGRLEREPNPSESIAIADAEAAALGLATRNVAPITLGSAWAIWPVVLIGAAGIGVWMPQRSPVSEPAKQLGASEPRSQAAADMIAESARQARAAAEGAVPDTASADQLRRLDEIERELLDGARDPEEALAEGAQGLETLADRAEQRASKTQLADETLREQMQNTLPARDDASDLYDALARGDLAAAGDAARALTEQRPKLSPEERSRLAEEMDRLADQLDQSPESGAAPEDTALAAALRDQGVQDPASLRDLTDPGELQNALEQQGVAPEAAEPLAEQLAEEHAERQAEQEARKDLQSLADATRDAAEQMRPPDPEPPVDTREPTPPDTQEKPVPETPQTPRDQLPMGQKPDAQPPQLSQDEKPAQRQGDQQGEQGGEKPGQRAVEKPGQDKGQKPGDRQSTQSGEKPGQREVEKPGQDEGEKPGDRQGAQGGERPGQQAVEKPGDRQGEQGGEKPGQQAVEKPGQDEGEKPGARQGAQGGEKPGQQAVEKPGQGQGQKPGERDAPGGRERTPGDPTAARPTDGGRNSQPGEQTRQSERPSGAEAQDERGQHSGDARSRDGVERLQRELERLSDRERQGRSQRDASRALREQAERLLERASPEQRRELERLAREMSPDQQHPEPGLRPSEAEPWRTEPFDARAKPTGDEQDSGRVIADWYDPNAAPRPTETPDAAPATAPMAEAARGAERAIERQAVPRSRSDLVRRVFERYRRRAGSGAEGAPPPGGS